MKEQAIDSTWFNEYLELYRTSLFGTGIADHLCEVRDEVIQTRDRGGKVLFGGNGGSAAIADHCAVDFTKNAGIRSISFSGAAWVSCLANDFGYEEWLAASLRMHADTDDLAVLISSSGRSPNILKAAEQANECGLRVITFSGLSPDNPLRSMGKLNLWVDSRAYNIVEMTHQIWILSVCDAIIGSAVYGTSPVR